MKTINSKQAYRIHNYVRKTRGSWIEGMDEFMVRLLIWNLKLPIRYYWKETKSYIFHRQGYTNWWCVSKDYYNKQKLELLK
jgi:hypothetical protein